MIFSGDNSYLVALVCLDAPSTLGSGVWVSSTWSHQLPHLDGPIQGSRHEIFAVRRKSDGVDGILMSIRAFKALNKISSGDIPDSDALIEGSGGDIARIWRNSDGGDTILDAE